MLFGRVKVDWALFITFSWIVVFVCSIADFTYFTLAVRKIHKFIVIVVILMLIGTILVSYSYDKQVVMYMGFESLFKGKVCILQ